MAKQSVSWYYYHLDKWDGEHRGGPYGERREFLRPYLDSHGHRINEDWRWILAPNDDGELIHVLLPATGAELANRVAYFREIKDKIANMKRLRALRTERTISPRP